jgi:hypothetical protein
MCPTLGIVYTIRRDTTWDMIILGDSDVTDTVAAASLRSRWPAGAESLWGMDRGAPAPIHVRH